MVGINRYRQLGRTLTTSFAVVCTTAKTREVKISGDNSVHLTENDPIQTLEFAVSETSEFELPENQIVKGLFITAAHRFRIMYRPSSLLEYTLLSICDKQFILNGSLLGQIKVVGEYEEPTICKLIYC